MATETKGGINQARTPLILERKSQQLNNKSQQKQIYKINSLGLFFFSRLTILQVSQIELMRFFK